MFAPIFGAGILITKHHCKRNKTTNVVNLTPKLNSQAHAISVGNDHDMAPLAGVIFRQQLLVINPIDFFVWIGVVRGS